MQDGDVADTWADISRLKDELDYTPKVSVKEGVHNFIEWYKMFYCSNKEVKKRSRIKMIDKNVIFSTRI
ncbi:hypothetical protein D3C86_1050970 [compost metagenome]